MHYTHTYAIFFNKFNYSSPCFHGCMYSICNARRRGNAVLLMPFYFTICTVLLGSFKLTYKMCCLLFCFLIETFFKFFSVILCQKALNPQHDGQSYPKFVFLVLIFFFKNKIPE